MQVQLIALFLSFNLLGISAAEETVEPTETETGTQTPIRVAVCVTKSIEQLRAESSQTEISALDALSKALGHTPCIDIGGIRTPLRCGVYRLSDESHITINACSGSIPDFLFNRGLNFGKLLRTFPELKTILSSRRMPASCLISHVGINIFDDVLGEKLGRLTSCSFEDMVNNYELLVEILPEFVSDFAEFLTLFKDGRFTYKSLKKGLPDNHYQENHPRYFGGDMQSEQIEDYVCMYNGEYYEMEHFSFSQRLADFCPHEELFNRILTEALDLRATTQINFIVGEESIGVYSQTVVNIPSKFTGKVDSNKLSEVSAWFLSKRREATAAGAPAA